MVTKAYWVLKCARSCAMYFTDVKSANIYQLSYEANTLCYPHFTNKETEVKSLSNL